MRVSGIFFAWTIFSRGFTNPHSDGYSIARRFRTSGHARRQTSASYSGDRQKNRAGWMRILYCETIFHRDVPRNCAQLSPRIDSRANLFSNAAISYQRKWRNSSSVKLASPGRLVGFGIVQGHMAAFLADDIKSNLFQRSHQFSCNLTSQPKPSLMALQKMPIGQLWGGGRLVDLLKSSLSRLWMA